MSYYDAIAPGYNQLYKEEQERKLRLIVQHANITPEQKLLDVGCGTAFSFDLFPCQCTGVEPSAGLISESKHKERIVQASAENLPFADDFFDVVVCVTAMHNFSDLERALKEMARVGKDQWIFSLLKKSYLCDRMAASIRKCFQVYREIDEGRDLLLFCKKS